jgi:hypothetical protein
MDDDHRVTSEPYRLMPPRKRAGSELGEALAAARGAGELREALDAARGTAPEPDDAADVPFWDASPPREPWPRRLARANWILIFTIVGSIAGVAAVIVAYLAWMKPR